MITMSDKKRHKIHRVLVRRLAARQVRRRPVIDQSWFSGGDLRLTILLGEYE